MTPSRLPDDPSQKSDPNPRDMSQAELDDYLDALVTQGRDDTPQFHRAHALWERNQ